MKSKVISERLPLELLEKIDELTANRNGFIQEAVAAKLKGVEAIPVKELTDMEKREVLKEGKGLSELLHDAMLKRLQQESDLLNDMPKEEFLKLVAGRLPKEENTDAGLERDVLSLRACLAGMPDMADVTKELNRVKGELFKAEHERDLNLALLRHGENKATLGELMSVVYRGAVEYTVELVARNALPGMGEGGGLTERGYDEIARTVKKEMDTLEIYRKK